MKGIFMIILWLLLLLSMGGNIMGKENNGFKLRSSVFVDGQAIPKKFTCQGESKGITSPDLQWSGTPKNTTSFALIVDDPDAPHGNVEPFVHWVLFNIPATTTEFKEGQAQGINGTTSFGHKKYGGPCPPSGNHRYFFKLYALDTKLDLSEGATKAQVLSAMQGHILGQATLMGTYQKS